MTIFYVVVTTAFFWVGVYYLVQFIDWIYDRVSYNMIIKSISNDFEQLLIENDHKLDHFQLDDFMDINYRYVADIIIELDENDNLIYTLKFREDI